MAAIKLADAKARFSELIDRAEQGEVVEITRRGKLVARIVPAEQPRPALDPAFLRQVTDSLPASPITAEAFMRELRDGARFRRLTATRPCSCQLCSFRSRAAGKRRRG